MSWIKIVLGILGDYLCTISSRSCSTFEMSSLSEQCSNMRSKQIRTFSPPSLSLSIKAQTSDGSFRAINNRDGNHAASSAIVARLSVECRVIVPTWIFLSRRGTRADIDRSVSWIPRGRYRGGPGVPSADGTEGVSKYNEARGAGEHASEQTSTNATLLPARVLARFHLALYFKALLRANKSNCIRMEESARSVPW